MCCCFLFTTITWSAPDIFFQIPIKETSGVSLAREINLPASWGTIRERFIPDDANSQPLLVHIQDAHANYEAQQNTRNILRYLKSKYGFDLVFLEGVTDRFDPRQIQFFEDKKLAGVTADLMARDGLIGGAELYLLEGLLEKDKEPMVAFGVETAGLYRKNIQDFGNVLEQKETTAIFLNDFRSRLFSLGSKILNKRLQHFLKFGPLTPHAERDLGHSLEMLKTKAKEILSFDLTDPENQFKWPQLIRYFQLQRLETEINFKYARKDSLKLIQWLQKQKELKPFIKGIKAFEIQKSPRKFLEEFYRAASQKEFT
ncbi:MAG TPA: hypothetical protein VD913_03650, partial [bacterium]|nr:hypothetical protein [bacterium]